MPTTQDRGRTALCLEPQDGGRSLSFDFLEEHSMAEIRKPWLPDPTQWEGTWRDDWRIMGQEGYLLDKKLQYRRFDRNIVRDDFDQCEFCWACFDKDEMHPMMAYYEPSGKYWICETCFHDFCRHFNWTVEEREE